LEADNKPMRLDVDTDVWSYVSSRTGSIYSDHIIYVEFLLLLDDSSYVN
jgi:hypothetical protein